MRTRKRDISSYFDKTNLLRLDVNINLDTYFVMITYCRDLLDCFFDRSLFAS